MSQIPRYWGHLNITYRLRLPLRRKLWHMKLWEGFRAGEIYMATKSTHGDTNLALTLGWDFRLLSLEAWTPRPPHCVGLGSYGLASFKSSCCHRTHINNFFFQFKQIFLLPFT